MTRAQIEADMLTLYLPFRVSPWLVLANGNAVFLNDDPGLAKDASPPETVEVCWLAIPRVTSAWPYTPAPGYYYPATYPCVDREAVWRAIDECGGVIGLVDPAQSRACVHADVRAHCLLKE